MKIKKLSTFRLILEIIGIVLLAWFANPMLVGVVNIGNIVGSALCALFTLCVYFWEEFAGLIHSLWKNIFGRICIICVTAVLTFSIISGLILSGFMVHAALKTPPQNKTVLVLGCKINGKEPSLMLKNRLDCAVEYLNTNQNSKCIVSGGQGEQEDIPEAEAMCNYLIQNGISADRILKETVSTNTEENIKFSKAIIDENNLGSEVVIVSDGFHQMRAGILAENEKLIPYAVSSATVWYLLPTYYMRELFALMNQIILE